MRIEISDAISLVQENISVLPGEEVELLSAYGRVAARQVQAKINQPPFNRSPLDGYAFRAEDSIGASKENPVELKIVDRIFAGDSSDVKVGLKEAVAIMTGAMIPKGANCVIRQEDTFEKDDSVQIFCELEKYENYIYRGEEYKVGDVLIPEGMFIDEAAITVAAGAGLTSLFVRRKPRVALITTGDEVITPGKELAPGKIYDSNTYYVKSRLERLKANLVYETTVGDNVEDIAKELFLASEKADIIITTGGVSVGQKDCIEDALKCFGGEIIFHGINIKPGMPTLFAKKGDTLVLGLSGNPFSAAVPFELIVSEIFYGMTKNSKYRLRHGIAVSKNSFTKKNKMHRYLRGTCHEGEVRLPDVHANGQMRSMIGCNCLVSLPASSAGISIGDDVELIFLK